MKDNTGKIPLQYLAGLSREDKKRQIRALKKSRKGYKRHVYVPRPHLKSFKNKKSRHVVDFEKKYGVMINDLKAVCKATGVPVGALKKIIKKGMGAYYSGGSRPNQTAHSWAYARLGSVLLKRNSYKIDKHVLDEYGVKKIKLPKTSKTGARVINCCKSGKKTITCVRSGDNKIFKIKDRRFTKKRCIDGPVRGFTMRSSCAPWKNCKKNN